MMRWIGVLTLAIAPAAMTGCVLSQTTEGSGIDVEKVERIVPGQSTRADVTRLLGPPDEVVYSNKELDPLFEQAYRYKRSKERQTAMFLILFSTFRSDEKFDHVMVFFDEEGAVEHVGTKLNSDLSSYGMPW